MKNTALNRPAHSLTMSSCTASSAGSGVPKTRPNSARWASPQRRNSRQAASIFPVMSGPAAVIAAAMSLPISVKMSPITCLTRSSWLPK